MAADKAKFLAVYLNAPGWVAIAFPEVAESMVPADAVIGREGTVQAYRLTSRSLSVGHWMRVNRDIKKRAKQDKKRGEVECSSLTENLFWKTNGTATLGTDRRFRCPLLPFSHLVC